MKASKLKNLVGIYSASLSLMGLIVPVSVLGSIAQAFPGTPIATIQLMVTLPSLIAIPTGILVSKLASRITKRSLILFFTAFYILAGTMPIYLHASMTELLLSAALVGVALGGLQNPMTAIITDVFEGEERFRYMNMLPTFICGGGTIYTMVAAMLGATDWTHAFYAYLIIGVFLVLEVFCTPKTVLEPKATKTEKAKVPREVYFLCAFGFLLYTACQVFNNNEAMLVAERGLGGVVEAGFGSTANTVAGIVSGFIATPLMRKLDKKYPVVLIGTGLVGLLCFALTSSVPMLCFAGFVSATSSSRAWSWLVPPTILRRWASPSTLPSATPPPASANRLPPSPRLPWRPPLAAQSPRSSGWASPSPQPSLPGASSISALAPG